MSLPQVLFWMGSFPSPMFYASNMLKLHVLRENLEKIIEKSQKNHKKKTLKIIEHHRKNIQNHHCLPRFFTRQPSNPSDLTPSRPLSVAAPPGQRGGLDALHGMSGEIHPSSLEEPHAVLANLWIIPRIVSRVYG